MTEENWRALKARIDVLEVAFVKAIAEADIDLAKRLEEWSRAFGEHRSIDPHQDQFLGFANLGLSEALSRAIAVEEDRRRAGEAQR